MSNNYEKDLSSEWGILNDETLYKGSIADKKLKEAYQDINIDLKNVIKTVRKKCKSDMSTPNGLVEIYDFELFLLSSVEIFGENEVSEVFVNEGYQYEKIVKSYGIESALGDWWTRTPIYSFQNNGVDCVNYKGISSLGRRDSKKLLRYGFCI